MSAIPVLMGNKIDAGDLTHAEVIEGRFGKEVLFGGRNWVDLVAVSLGQGYRKLLAQLGQHDALQGLKDHSGCTIRPGLLDGHKPIPNTNLCFRYRDAKSSWRAACAMADLLDTGIELTVRWTRPNAKYANERCRLIHESPTVKLRRIEREILGTMAA